MELIHLLTLKNIIFTVIIIYVLRFIKNTIIRPYLLALHYRKQGLPIYYFPIIGNITDAFKDVKEHGDIFYKWKNPGRVEDRVRAAGTNRGGSVVLYLYDPLLIKEYVAKNDIYEKSFEMFTFYKELFKCGVAFAEGKTWKRHRKYTSMAFHYEFLKLMVPDVTKITLECFEGWLKKDLNNIDFLPEAQFITGEIVGRIFFGQDFSNLSIRGQPVTKFLADLIEKIAKETMNPMNILLGPSIIKAKILPNHKRLFEEINEFRSFGQKIVSQRMKEGETYQKTADRKSMLELFHEQRLQSPDDALTDEEILDEFCTFFFAGMDTTSHLILMASYYYMTHPEYQEKLLSEIKRNFANPHEINIEMLNGMDYMTAFLKESLRFGSPTPLLFDRVALKDNTLGDLQIKKDTVVNIGLLANNYDDRFHNEPQKFDPERWLSKTSKTHESTSNNPFVFTPFAVGARNCIGQHLAMNEAKVIFGLFLKMFNFELKNQNYKLVMNFKGLYEPDERLIYKLSPKNIIS